MKVEEHHGGEPRESLVAVNPSVVSCDDMGMRSTLENLAAFTKA